MTDYKPPPIKPPSEIDDDTAPATRGRAVQPGDDINPPARSLWIGYQGDLHVVMAGDTTPVVYPNVIGLFPGVVKRIEPGTTASGIVAMW